MAKCFDCSFRTTCWCDKHGEIPATMVEREHRCPDYVPHEESEVVLNRWLAGVDPLSIEAIYIKALIDAMQVMRISDQIDAAICWLYSLPDSISVRAVRASVQVFDTRELPI
jgi:hypothetical protein